MPRNWIDQLDPAPREAIRAAMIRRQFARGALIFGRSELPQGIFIIREGSAAFFLDGPGGERLLLKVFHPNEILGETVAFDARPAPASIEATGLDERDLPQSIGRLSAFAGNTGVLLRAWVYLRLLGWQGLTRVSGFATLNANYVMARLRTAGFDLAYPSRRATHEFIVTLKRQAKELGVNALDYAKRLLDHEVHAPTTYFPLLVPECLLIEPTETESRETLDAFVEALIAIDAEARGNPEIVRSAPHSTVVRRLDDVRASRQPDIVWQAPGAVAPESAAAG